MSHLIEIEKPERFDFKRTVLSHGWSSLAPFRLDRENWVLDTVLNFSPPISVSIREVSGKLQIRTFSKVSKTLETRRIAAAVRHILRLDDDLNEFYRLVKTDKQFCWIEKQNAGRLLRSQTVFEDLLKTLCTTNCSWALTNTMISNLVEKLGEPTTDGKRAFPTPAIVAQKNEDFYRTEIRAGYRAPYFSEIARKICDGQLDVESWLDSELPTAELKKEIKKIKGIGDYAAENLLKLLGRYDGLALDSWLRGGFYKKHNGGAVCEDRQIYNYYQKFGEWRGLVMWCDMTEKWL